jgi:DNA-binding CsgD family transcriptional regulator
MPSYVRGQGRRTLSDEEIIRLYLSGIDSDTISYRANCSGTTVISLVRAAGHEIRKKGGRRHSLPTSDADIAKRYTAGETGPQIARDIGCTPSSVYHVLRRLGVPIRDDAASVAKLAARNKKANRDG